MQDNRWLLIVIVLAAVLLAAGMALKNGTEGRACSLLPKYGVDVPAARALLCRE